MKFNLEALIRAAENAVGSGTRCAEVTKLPEGNFNKTLLVKMQDGHEVIARLPNPNSGQSHFTTASEVAIMDYVRALRGVVLFQLTLYTGSQPPSDSRAKGVSLQYTSKDESRWRRVHSYGEVPWH